MGLGGFLDFLGFLGFVCLGESLALTTGERCGTSACASATLHPSWAARNFVRAKTWARVFLGFLGILVRAKGL